MFVPLTLPYIISGQFRATRADFFNEFAASVFREFDFLADSNEIRPSGMSCAVDGSGMFSVIAFRAKG